MIAVFPAVRAWRKMLSAVVLHDDDGEQSFTSALWNEPVTWPPYCVRLFCDVFVSVQSVKYGHCVARLWRYGIWPLLKPSPTFDQVRFSNEKTTTDVY